MDNSRADFQRKLRSWFQNKGIIDKLVLYLRSQMFVELQNHSKESVGIEENDSVSPRLQAVKLLIADFLLQENLLFALSVFCSEIPVLMNFKRYTNYISHLANAQANSPSNLNQPKPKFTRSDVQDILEALGLRLTKDEIAVVHKMYKSDRFNSLLYCLLYLLPSLLKKNRYLQRILLKIKKKEKYFKRAIRLEKTKVCRMYSLIQNTHGVVLKHKSELNLALQKQNEILEKENIINKKEEYLISKEKDVEKYFQEMMQDIEKKTAILTKKDNELQERYKKFLEEQEALVSEKTLWVEKTNQMYSAQAYETVKLQEYEQKFHTLQNEVFEILKQCRQVQHKREVEFDKSVNKEIQCRFDIINQSQQTEANDTLNLEEYVNLMEKENSLLKSSSFKQRQYIAQLTTEMVFLKNRLDYLEKDLQIKTQFERRKQMNEVAEKLYSPRFAQFDRPKSASTSNLKIKRKLFPEKECPSSSEFTSSTSKEDTSLTDELVAEAKHKLKQLENESEALNKNFKNLQTVLTKNISFSDETSQSGSPIDRLARKYATVSPKLLRANSNLSDSDSNVNSGSSFKKMYLKYKQNKRQEKPMDGDGLKSFVSETAKVDHENNTEDQILLDQKLEENSNIKDVNEENENHRVLVNDKNNILQKENSIEELEIQNIVKETSNLNISFLNKSSESSFKREGEMSTPSKDSENSSDFWK